MSDSILVIMISVSLLLGLLSLMAFLWGIKNNQFEDKERSMNAVLFDSEDDLNDMAKRMDKKKSYEKKRNSEKS